MLVFLVFIDRLFLVLQERNSFTRDIRMIVLYYYNLQGIVDESFVIAQMSYPSRY